MTNLSGPSPLLCATAFALVLVPQPLGARTVQFQFNANNFTTPRANAFYPLDPATYVYKAETPDGCEIDIVEVTALTRVVAGVTTTVVRDNAYEDEDCDGAEPDELVEKTEDWFAADNSGNVWYFGEDTRHCEEGVCEPNPGDGSWEAGVAGALPGIIMLAEPKSGDQYRQEFALGVAEDWGKVMNLDASVRLRGDEPFPPGEFDGCIVTKEWNDLESGSVEHKTYCEGVGLVLVEEHSGKLLRLELTDDSTGVATDELRFREVPRR